MRPLIYRLRNRTAALVHDLMMVPLAWFGALWLRFNLETIPHAYWQRALLLLPLVLAIHGVAFLYFGLYRGVWRFASMPDFVRILKAVTAALVGCLLLVLMTTEMRYVPRSAFVLHGLLLLAMLCLPRFFYRWLKDYRRYFGTGERVLIVGAGQAGEMLVRDLLRDTDGGYWPIGFVDDDSRKKGTEVRGVRVLGHCQDIARLVVRHRIDRVLIAIPSASAAQLRRIVAFCENSERPFRTLPRWHDLLADHAILHELREVSIEDLLGREPVELDWNVIGRAVRGRTVLVSGGGGSIGSELCRQVAALEPAQLIIIERSEFNLYQIDLELRERFPALVLHARLMDVCDQAAVNKVFAEFQPDTVYHAAAYKHVPLLEVQAREAIRNNLFGTINMAGAADRLGCGTFVLISTDKAVNPANLMGVSKQLAEIYCQNFNRRSSTRFVIVRFGNVLGSAGSVVPLFRRQIENGGPVTVTHPDVSRYFMTIPEASQLILQAGAVGEGGEIYVLDMGEAVNIRYLAEQMILLSGKQPGTDIQIVFTGLRPGEKLQEELFHASEDLVDTGYPKLRLAQQRKVDWAVFSRAVDVLGEAISVYDEPRVRAVALRLVRDMDDETPVEVARLGRIVGG